MSVPPVTSERGLQFFAYTKAAASRNPVSRLSEARIIARDREKAAERVSVKIESDSLSKEQELLLPKTGPSHQIITSHDKRKTSDKSAKLSSHIAIAHTSDSILPINATETSLTAALARNLSKSSDRKSDKVSTAIARKEKPTESTPLSKRNIQPMQTSLATASSKGDATMYAPLSAQESKKVNDCSRRAFAVGCTFFFCSMLVAGPVLWGVGNNSDNTSCATAGKVITGVCLAFCCMTIFVKTSTKSS